MKKSLTKKKTTNKIAAKKRKSKKRPAPANISKAQSIRDMSKELGKKARPKDIIAALAAEGIVVSSPQVSLTLKAAGLRKGRRKPTAVAVTNASRNGKSQTYNVNDLIQVKELAIKLGGIDKLKETVAQFEQLRSIWYGV
jgi:hypothetical protein